MGLAFHDSDNDVGCEGDNVESICVCFDGCGAAYYYLHGDYLVCFVAGTNYC